MSNESEQFEWMTLETFATKEEGEALAALLQENAIEANLVNDANMGGDPLGLDFQNRGASTCIVRVHAKDIETARQILEAAVQAAAAEEADDASMEMLSTFNDEELLEILQKPDEWNPENVVLARKILASHGKNYSEADLKRLFEERVEALRKPVEVKTSSLIFAFVGSAIAIVIAILHFSYKSETNFLYALLAGGICACLSLIAGLNWCNRKKRLPNGEKVYVFEDSFRKKAWIELIVAAISLGAVVCEIAVRTA
ncbi:MAG: hypothetical protein J6Z31_06355 [Fibrobacter sp.]|nr:hypothetical protein [Fibrobacter sp.]